MGILARCGDILRSNVNALLDKAEDPAKMADQMVLDARRDLAEARKEATTVIAAKKAAERDLDKCKEEIAQYSLSAENAVKAGADADALKLLERKKVLENDLANYQKIFDAAKVNADRIEQLIRKLTADVETLDARRNQVKAVTAVAKAQERVNQSISGVGFGSAMEKFEQMEDAAVQRLDAALAGAEMAEQKSDASTLLEKYSGSGGSSSTSDELAALKAKLGKE